MRVSVFAGVAVVALATAAAEQRGVATWAQKRQSADPPTTLPLLELDYATYQAAAHDNATDIYTFKNIRYAAAPTGNQRWMRPQPPNNISGIQDGSVGYTCLQPLGGGISSFPEPLSEDCLFLDVYVPGKVARSPANYSLPVVVWVHGGTNNRGSKDQTPGFWWDGTGPIQNSNNSLIFVAMNYRLGPWGWLAGDTMEKHGLPNAGLHDQRAAFRWVQKYISLVGGDKSKVTAWGVSAGASDIVHHLIAQGGTLDPLFSKAFLQSPGSMPFPDRLGFLENCTQAYIALANCTSLDCLRGQSSQVLQDAAVAWKSQNDVCGGIASDGTYVRQAATLEFVTGNYWKGLESIIVEHTSDEPDMFLPTPLDTDADFQSYLAGEYPSYAGSVLNSTLFYYPSPNSSAKYASQSKRCAAWLRDFIFAARVRTLAQAYAGKIWLSRYTIPTRQNKSLHASDLIPLFWNYIAQDSGMKITPWLYFSIPTYVMPLSITYQSYMTSHAVTGDPNTFTATSSSPSYPAIPWPQPGNITSEHLTGVLNFGTTAISTVTDPDMLKSGANFEHNAVIALTNLGGFAVPGTAMTAQLPMSPSKGKKQYITLRASAAASKNYKDQCTECRET